MPMAISFPRTPNVGDVYTVNQTTWKWNGTAWKLFAGAEGTAGKSAFQIALEQGFVGSEADWIASLHGPMASMAPTERTEPTVQTAQTERMVRMGLASPSFPGWPPRPTCRAQAARVTPT
jgi:hypothetical protein